MTPSFRAWLPPRPPDAHKNRFGHVVVVGGSRGLLGAPRLAAAGALRAGAGLVTVAVPASLEWVVAVSGPWEAMTLGLPDRGGAVTSAGAKRLERHIARRRITAVVLGPGLSEGRGAEGFVAALRKSLAVPAVVDAGALNVLARRAPRAWPAGAVFTPHPGEAARLLGVTVAAVQADRRAAARAIARRHGVVCALKGNGTVVSDGRRTVVNPTGNPGLATGGTGDVLAGVIGALLGQVRAPNPSERLWRAAVAGVRLHGSAGDRAARAKRGAPLTAGDVVDAIPEAFRRVFGGRA